MSTPTDNETWIIETGDNIVKRMAHDGLENLTQWEKLVYCFWVADYGMRNAGDLDTAADMHPAFLSEAHQIASALSLPKSIAAFSLSKDKLESEYFIGFDAVAEEIRQAELRPK